MPAFEGVGGRKKKRTRKPTTSTGIQLQQSLALEVVDAIRTSENISQEHITHDHQDHPSQLEIRETYNYSTNQQETFEGQETAYDQPTDPQVDNLLAYLQTEDYKRKKLLEEKHWNELGHPTGETWQLGIATGKNHANALGPD
ncbi:uncharacterized protein PGTG_16014 [Puccinia graminis f. sp. tritici CRL 75-36-700-3]|uniref:Uncharacterized protein n=1 Tax=Puccinia graminis f. sp. tritici (strain CRL 75-36-700-3 / race SCCL) TaxID=418459 RepID=E3L1K2_PUCGT|nr:uncharacterized protein PGTG_16014 [Puccinia graminis f. sp. tritici CRL 75-36-700-3]EFP90427.1 hypothetical protein PGTG_16014 [Puccinia graminis f. sp. tritici CRL 75-36-700-3]